MTTSARPAVPGRHGRQQIRSAGGLFDPTTFAARPLGPYRTMPVGTPLRGVRNDHAGFTVSLTDKPPQFYDGLSNAFRYIETPYFRTPQERCPYEKASGFHAISPRQNLRNAEDPSTPLRFAQDDACFRFNGKTERYRAAQVVGSNRPTWRTIRLRNDTERRRHVTNIANMAHELSGRTAA